MILNYRNCSDRLHAALDFDDCADKQIINSVYMQPICKNRLHYMRYDLNHIHIILLSLALQITTAHHSIRSYCF